MGLDCLFWVTVTAIVGLQSKAAGVSPEGAQRRIFACESKSWWRLAVTMVWT